MIIKNLNKEDKSELWSEYANERSSSNLDNNIDTIIIVLPNYFINISEFEDFLTYNNIIIIYQSIHQLLSLFSLIVQNNINSVQLKNLNYTKTISLIPLLFLI